MQYKEKLEAALGKLPSPLMARVEETRENRFTIVLLRENKYRRPDTVGEIYVYGGQLLASVMEDVQRKLAEEKEFKELLRAPDLEGGTWWS